MGRFSDDTYERAAAWQAAQKDSGSTDQSKPATASKPRGATSNVGVDRKQEQSVMPKAADKPSGPSAGSDIAKRGGSVSANRIPRGSDSAPGAGSDKIPRGSDKASGSGPTVRSSLEANLSAVGAGVLGQAFRAGKGASRAVQSAPSFKQANEALKGRMGAAVEGAKKVTARKAEMKSGNDNLKSRMSSAVEGAKKATAPKSKTQKAEEAAKARFNKPGSAKGKK